MPRKLPQHAFEEAHPEAAAAVRQWFFSEKPACSHQEASERLRSRFGLHYSAETMRKFWHRCQKLQTEKDSLRAYLIEAGEMAEETLKVQDHTLFLKASIVQVGALCNRLLAERTPEPETVEKLGNLMTMLVTGAREVRSAEELQFDREKYKESLRTKTDVALDAFAEFLKGQPALMEKFNALRAEVKAVMS